MPRPQPGPLDNNHGFTMIAAITVVVIIGIMASVSVQNWKTVKQRELEEELIFRGDQVAEIIYQKLNCKQIDLNKPDIVQLALWPTESPSGSILDELAAGRDEICTDGGKRKFRLRRTAILDPLTNEPWQLITPVANKFSGVASKGTGTPFKKDFRDLYDNGKSPDMSLAPVKAPDGVEGGPYSADLLNRDRQQAEQKTGDAQKQYSDWQFTWELKLPAQPINHQPKPP